MTPEQQRAVAIASARRRRAEAEAAATQQQEEVSQEETLPTTTEGWVQRGMDAQQQNSALAGLADAGLSVATGTVGSIVGGASAAVDLVRKGNWQSASDVYDNVSNFFQYAPKTERGQKILGGVGNVVDKAMTKGRDWNVALVGEDNPKLATAVETFVLGLPEIIMGAKLPKSIKANSAAAKPAILQEMDSAAKRLGLDLNNNTIKESVIESARRMAGDESRATSGANDIHGAARGKFDESRKAVNAEYTLARSKNAEVAIDPIERMAKATEKELMEAGADFGDDRVLTRRFQELEQIREKMIGARKGQNERQVPGQSTKIVGPDGQPFKAEAPQYVPLDELEIMNARLSSDITEAFKGGRAQEAIHLRKLRENINTMLDEQFTNDMIRGDKAAKDQWVKARLANRRHKERFTDDKVIRDIVSNQRTAKDTIKVIFGASEIGHRAEAFKTVRKLKEILGPDAPELESLRIALYSDMFEPIFKDKPSWTGALERIRRVKRDDMLLLNELGMSEKDIGFMERAIKVASNVKTKADFDGKGLASQMIARFGFGHDIAVGGARMKLVNMVMDKALGVGQKSHERLLKEFAGLDDGSPLLIPTDPRVANLNLNAMMVGEIQNADEDPAYR